MVIVLVDGMVKAKAGKAQVLGNEGLDLLALVVEKGPRKGKGLAPRPRADDRDPYRAIVVEPGVEELDREGELLLLPECFFGFEADVSPLIVLDVHEGIGDLALGAFERIFGEGFRLGNHALEGKGCLGDGGRGQDRPWTREDHHEEKQDKRRRPQ